MTAPVEKGGEIPGVDISALAGLSILLAEETTERFMRDNDPYRTPGGGHDFVSDTPVLDAEADRRIEEAIRRYRASDDIKRD